MNVDEKNVFSEFKKLIVSSSFTDEQILKLSDKLGLYFANSREGTKENSRTQIRKFFDLVKKTKASAESAQRRIALLSTPALCCRRPACGGSTTCLLRQYRDA